MRVRVFLIGMSIAVVFPARAGALPSTDQDYYSLQIASGRNPQAMEKLFQRYADFPFVRIEKRDNSYVLRAGFWEDKATARVAMVNSRVDASFLRVAAYRPDAILLKNWQDGGQPSDSPLSTLKKTQSESLSPGPSPSRSANTDLPPAGGAGTVLLPFNQEDFVLAYDVFVSSGDLEQAYRVAEKAARQAPQDKEWQKRLATVAAWTQRHEVAAEYYFQARQQTSDRDEARRLFLAGIDALMAGSRFRQAMEAADKYLGDLGNDRVTLRHLARSALAAGEPARAAVYIDRLVFRPQASQGKP